MLDKREAQVQARRPASGGPDAAGLVMCEDGVLVQQRGGIQQAKLVPERVVSRTANTVEKACRPQHKRACPQRGNLGPVVRCLA